MKSDIEELKQLVKVCIQFQLLKFPHLEVVFDDNNAVFVVVDGIPISFREFLRLAKEEVSINAKISQNS